MTEKVELHCAYQWDCPDCGREQFCRAITVEMSEEDVAAMREDYGGEPEDWRTGQWMSRPDEVTCAGCGATFETEEWEGPTKKNGG